MNLRRSLKSLRDKKGKKYLELITLYIPLDKQIFDVTNQLKKKSMDKLQTCKSKLTRTNVQGAIESLLSRLKYLDKVPENGIVYFTGGCGHWGQQNQHGKYRIDNSLRNQLIAYKYSLQFHLLPSRSS